MKRAGSDISGAVEQRLVPIRQADQIDVALEIVRLRIEMPQHALDLPVEAFHRVRQQPFQPIFAALFRSERRTFVGAGSFEQRLTSRTVQGLNVGGLDHVISLFCFSGSG